METNSSLIEVTGENTVLDGIMIDDMTTNAKSNDRTNPIFGIKVAGENAVIKNSTINGPTEGKAYSMLFIDGSASGPVIIEGNTFDNLDGVHNVLEFNNGYQIPDGTIIRDNKFVGDVSHTSITMMNIAPYATIKLENNEMNGIRISNTANAEATIEFKGGKALFNESYEDDWGYLLIQQLGQEDYSKMTIIVDGLKKEDGTDYKENTGTGKDLFCSLYSNSGEEHKISNDKAPVIIFKQGHDKIFTARDGNNISYNKKVSELQENVAISPEGKITGTLLYVTNYTDNPSHKEGNFLAFHINKDKLPLPSTDDNLQIGWDRSLAKFDPNDYNCTFRIDVDDRHKKPLKILLNDEVIYEFDLSGLVLKK